MSNVLFWPLLLGMVLAVIILWRADSPWVRARAVLMFLLYPFILILLYFPSYLALQPSLLATFGTSFTDGVAYFSGEELLGQLWLASLIADFTIGFTRTRVGILRNIQQVLDFAVYAGIVVIFLWKMGFIVFT
jgi:hypothetical protein